MNETPEVTDSHCHLDFPDFEGQLDEFVARAERAGVTRMVTICTKLVNEPQVRAIAETYANIYYAAGTHPMSAADQPLVTVDDLVALAQHPKMVGIGETGLDYHYTAESEEIQQTSLRIHIEAARCTGLPLIIHARAADDDMARILTEEHANGASFLRDALLFLQCGTGARGAGPGVLPVDVRHCRLSQKPRFARHLCRRSSGSHSC